MVVKVKNNKYSAKNIIIATGSNPSELKNVKFDEKYIVSSTGALSFNKIPEKLAVIGAGYIGLELGSVWSRLGSEVTVIEYDSSIVPTMDSDIADKFYKELKLQGLSFLLKSEVINAKVEGNKVFLNTKSVADNSEDSLVFDKALLAVGRIPNIKGLGLENLNIKINSKGNFGNNNFYHSNYESKLAIWSPNIQKR